MYCNLTNCSSVLLVFQCKPWNTGRCWNQLSLTNAIILEQNSRYQGFMQQTSHLTQVSGKLASPLARKLASLLQDKKLVVSKGCCCLEPRLNVRYQEKEQRCANILVSSVQIFNQQCYSEFFLVFTG